MKLGQFIVALWPIGKVKPYPKNARTLSDSAVEKVAKSIELYGWRQPIVVDAKGVIIAGHTRHKAALKLKLKEVPVHVAKDLAPAAVKAYRLMDNRSHQESSWDDALLAVRQVSGQKPTSPGNSPGETGRPRAAIDLKLVEDLASLMCTDAEIASGLGVNRATVARRKKTRQFHEALERGRDRGKMSLRRWQFENAKRGNVAAQIWLGKQYLGQRDRVLNEHGLGAGAEGALTGALDRLFARLDRHAARAAAGAVPGV